MPRILLTCLLVWKVDIPGRLVAGCAAECPLDRPGEDADDCKGAGDDEVSHGQLGGVRPPKEGVMVPEVAAGDRSRATGSGIATASAQLDPPNASPGPRQM